MDRGKQPVHYEDEDDEPVQIGSVSEATDETAALCLLGKLWTDRPYNSYGLIETMKKLWCPTKGMICRELGNNLISFQFHNRRDMERVLSMEPWQFNKHILVLTKLSTDIQPSLMPFDKAPCWIRLYDVPIGGRQKEGLRMMGCRFGEVLEIDESTTSGLARSVRLKILLDLNKPLKRGTRIRLGSATPCWIPATYERLPSFCYWCGKLGHSYKDCDQFHDQVSDEKHEDVKKFPYGEWMKASPMKQAQIIPDKGNEENDKLRRSLFSRPHGTKQKAEIVFDDLGLNRKEDTFDTTTHVSALLTSLEKVQVGEKPMDLLVKGIKDPNKNCSRVSTDKAGEMKEAPNLQNLVVDKPCQPQKPQPPVPSIAQQSINNTPQPTSQITIQNNKPQPTPANTYHPMKSKQTSHKPDNHPKQHTTAHPSQHLPDPTFTAQSETKANIRSKPQQQLKHPTAPTASRELNQKSPLYNGDESNQPYTPISRLIEIVNNSGLVVKSEPLSSVQQRNTGKCGLQDETKKWKRNIRQPNQKKGENVEVGIKRKEDLMDVDLVYLGDIKKTKNTIDDTFVAPAETAQQSRRAL